MLLVVKSKDKLILEEVRTVKVNLKNNTIIYYRKTHYAGEAHEVNLEHIENAYVKESGETIEIIK